MKFAIGLDLGGTSTRALVVDGHGRRVAEGRSGGGNPVSHGTEQAVSAMIDAAGQALHGIDPSAVESAFAGVAGYTLLLEQAERLPFERAWESLGTNTALRLSYDVDAAFAAGTPKPDGVALVAGTGAVAALLHQHHTHRLTGGRGWLLGDEGSGFWLGREAVRALLDVVEDAESAGPLTEAVRARFLTGREENTLQRGTVLRAVHADQPIALARLAPLVSEAAQQGDPSALRIVRAAANHLVALLERARNPEDSTPVVLTGSVLSPDGPVATALRALLEQRWPGVEVRHAGEPVAGAAWLACCALFGAAAAAPLHPAIVGASGTAGDGTAER